MLIHRRNKTILRVAVAITIIASGLLIWRSFFYIKDEEFEKFYATEYGAQEHLEKPVLTFPASFPEDPSAFAQKHFDRNLIRGLRSVKAQTPQNNLVQQLQTYTDYSFNVYNTAVNIKKTLSKCLNILQKFKVKISGSRSLQQDIRPMLEEMVKQIDEGTNDYLALFSELFLDELRIFLVDEDRFYRHWFKFAGSSVWLKEYGVHFMISRVVYTKNLSRNSPDLSLMYGQVFDENWKEIKGFKMAVPSNDINFKDHESETYKAYNAPTYAILEWPSFIPVPFYHHYKNPDEKYFGPEDGHVSLVVNPAGHEEPVIAFNARHVKFYENLEWTEGSDDLQFEPKDHRTMFLTYPFQFQVGKANVDGKNLARFSEKIYNRVTELRISGTTRDAMQKNWVPFVNHEERTQYGYDRYIYFVYRWSSLEILKCDLKGICVFEYKLDLDLRMDLDVGDLRGGTQMVNINQLLFDSANTTLHSHIKSLIPVGREVWVGFPRAHIDACGCATNLYRPNFSVIIMDTVPGATGALHTVFKLSHVSSSVDFNIPIIGWDLNNPLKACDGAGNVLISNGMSSWNVPEVTSKNGKLVVEDYLTLMLSIGDYTIHTVDIKGLLEQILDVEGPQIFGKTAKPELPGYNDDNLFCAMKKSFDLCSVYRGEFAALVEAHGDEVNQFIEDMVIPYNLADKPKPEN